MATKRACGIKALLKDISNEALQEPRAKRFCASKAATKLRVQALRVAPKLVSQMSDEGFRRSVKKYVLDNGYMKGKPNLTLQQVATWLKEEHSLDVSVMVSDFIDEVNGFLQYDDRKARLLLETQSDGYFNNEMLLEQVDEAITIFEDKYPECQGMFIFDNAPSHMKEPDDALNVEKMNVKDGGKQPFMKDTIWNGNVQKMVTAEGIQKGLRTVLGERGINTDGMVAEKLRSILRQHKVHTVFIIVTTFYSYNVTLTLMSNNCKHSSNKSSTKRSIQIHP